MEVCGCVRVGCVVCVCEQVVSLGVGVYVEGCVELCACYLCVLAVHGERQ